MFYATRSIFKPKIHIAPLRCQRIALPCVCGITVAISLFLGALSNDFPVAYHPDEASKAEQLIVPDTSFNFNHPLFMLQSARCIDKIFGVPETTFDTVRAGRYLSAVFVAGGILALSLFGFVSGGLWEAALCGLTVTLCPQLVLAAHYFKEDAALFFGFALTLLASRIISNRLRPILQLVAAGILGMSLSIAGSSKYIGLVFAAPATFAVLCSAGGGWRLALNRSLLFFTAFFVMFVFLNAPAFRTILPPIPNPQVYDHFRGEIEHSLNGQGIVSLSKPNTFLLQIAIEQTMPHVGLLLLTGISLLIVTRGFSRPDITFFAFGFTAAVALMFCAIPFARYALPIIVCLYLGAAHAASRAIHQLLSSACSRRVCFVVLISLVAILQGKRCLLIDKGFQDDSRQRLREWAAARLPLGCVVVADSYTNLGGDGDLRRFPHQAPLRCTVKSRLFAAAIQGSLEKLVHSGVDYVAVGAPSYERFFASGIHASAGSEQVFAQCKCFYTELFSRGRVVWSYVPEHPTHGYTNPEIYVFDITELRSGKRSVMK